MPRRSLVPCLLLVALVLLAGCSSPGTGGERTTEPASQVAISVSNEDRTGYAVQVLAARELADVTVTYANGTTRRLEVRSMDRIPPSALDDATDVRLRGGPDAELLNYTLPPGSGLGDTLNDVPRNTSLFYVVTERGVGGGVHRRGALRCGPDARLIDLRIAILVGGRVDVVTDCVG